MSRDIVFHINNMAYSIENIDANLEKDVRKHLNIENNVSTKELLLAYLRMAQEYNTFKNDVERISSKLPKIE